MQSLIYNHDCNESVYDFAVFGKGKVGAAPTTSGNTTPVITINHDSNEESHDVLVKDSSINTSSNTSVIGCVSTDKAISFSHKEELSNPNSLMSNEEAITIYPNPVLDELKIDIMSVAQSELFIKISDLNGRIIQQIQTRLFEGASKISIDVSNLANGVYSIQLADSKDMNYIQKFVKY